MPKRVTSGGGRGPLPGLSASLRNTALNKRHSGGEPLEMLRLI